MRRQGAKLIPVDDIAADDLVRVPANRDVMVKITSSRNMKLMRFLWALASKVADACDHLHDREDAMDELKIRVRHVKYITNPATGEVRIVPKSLTKLDGPGLSRLADRMVFVICRDIVPGLNEETLRAEIMAMIDGTNSNSSQSVSSPDTTETDTPASDPLAPHTATDAGNHSETEAQRGPAAKPLPPAPSGDEPRTSDQEPLSNGSGEAHDRSESASPSTSTLAPDWQQTYLTAMQRATDRPKSLLTRHTEAIQIIGGKANQAEQDWMRSVFDLRKQNLEGKLSKADYDAAIREMVDG